MKFGGDIRHVSMFAGVGGNTGGGAYNFNNLFTSVNPTAPGNTGFGMASFMLGDNGASGSISTSVASTAFTYYGAAYAQDTFQATNKLTLNYGLRYDMPLPNEEQPNYGTVLMAFTPSPVAAQVGMPNLLGTQAAVDTSAYPSRRAAATHHTLFAPRVGLAYRLPGKTVIRTGYSLIWAEMDGLAGGGLGSGSTNWNSTLDGSITPGAIYSNPFPQGIAAPVLPSTPNWQLLKLGGSVSGPVPNYAQPMPYNQQWNVALQRELAEGLSLEVDYVGANAHHLGDGGYQMTQSQNDQLPDADLALGSKLLQQVPNPFLGIAPSTSAFGPATVAYGQLLRPWPQYTGLAMTDGANRNTTYNSMYVKLNKRFKEGGTLMANYAWTQYIGNVETQSSWLENQPTAGIQNYNCLSCEKSQIEYNVRHRLVVAYVYDIPMGKGQKLLGNISGPADKVLSGWGFNGMSTFQSGYVIQITDNTNTSNSLGGGQRPNVVSGCNYILSGPAQSRLNGWFNTSCFTPAAPFTFGNLGRTVPGLNLAGINNWDFALFKNTSLSERFKLQFRAEFFNLTNRVQFGPPNESVGNALFGVVSSQANNPRLIQMALRLMY